MNNFNPSPNFLQETPKNFSNGNQMLEILEDPEAEAEAEEVEIEENLPNLQVVEKKGQRLDWDNKIQFIFSCVSYAVGLGNVWRFPYLCQQNGGGKSFILVFQAKNLHFYLIFIFLPPCLGAFVIPYIIMMVLEGVPVFLLEMGIGQRLRTGCIGVWNQV